MAPKSSAGGNERRPWAGTACKRLDSMIGLTAGGTMDTGTATTTRDILGLAVLAVLFEKPSSCIVAVDAVRTLCLPWLTPTREVVASLVTEFCGLGYLHEGGRPKSHPQSQGTSCPDGGCLAISEDGERELRRLALHGTGQPPHPLVILCESLRLSVAHRLDPHARDEILRGQMRARRRCLAVQRRRLVGTDSENSVHARILRHQIACAQAELDRLAGAEDSQIPAGADSEQRRRRAAACLPLTHDEGELP